MSNPNITLSIASAQNITDPPVRTKVVRISEWYSSQSEGCNVQFLARGCPGCTIGFVGVVPRLPGEAQCEEAPPPKVIRHDCVLRAPMGVSSSQFGGGSSSEFICSRNRFNTSTVEWAITELLRNPNILAQAQHELDSIVGKDRLVKESDLARLTFLQAVIKENFRLHPSTPLSLSRIAQHSCEINGYFIPKHSNFSSTFGPSLVTQTYGPNIWPDPLEFWPERFLERPDVDVRGNGFELIPFGAGRRICAGMSLGIRMVQLLVATLIMEEAYGLTLQRTEPLMIRPRPMLARHAYQA